MNPEINISVNWLNIKRLHCRHSKIFKWLNQTKHTLWGSPRRDLQKIGWGRMSYHVFQKETVNLCFLTHKKKIKIAKREKNVMSIAQFSWFKTFCIARYKVHIYCILRRRLHASAFQNSCFTSGYKCIDFSLYTNFQNPMSYLLSLGWEALLKSQPFNFL